MSTIVDLFLHVDRHLVELVAAYGPWVYALLFAIVFAETGLVVTPFLPGDSLLFASGALAAKGALELPLLTPLLVVAAVAGDAFNYAVGRRVGRLAPTASPGGLLRFVDRRHVDRAHEFFETHGGKAIVLGRFVPIVRTFVPFVAGAAEMSYPAFAIWNVAGAVIWVGVCSGAGYLFGNMPIVREHFSLVVLGIVAVSVLPVAVELARARLGRGTRGHRVVPAADGA